MKKLLIILILSLIVLNGCENVDIKKITGEITQEDINKIIVCEEPYIRYGAGCCLDQDKNKICDNDEGNIIIDESQGEIEEISTSTITVSPTILSFEPDDIAKMITIKVFPDDRGIRKRIILYRVKTGGYDSSIQSETVSVCNQDYCYDDVTISYRIDVGLLEGRYYFMINDVKSNIFEIKHE